MKFRWAIGDLDVASGILFLVGIFVVTYDSKTGLILMGIAILKQFSGK